MNVRDLTLLTWKGNALGWENMGKDGSIIYMNTFVMILNAPRWKAAAIALKGGRVWVVSDLHGNYARG